MRRVVPLVFATVFFAIVAGLAINFHENARSPQNAVHVSIFPGAGSYSTGYDPDNITVVIGVNNTVIWTNNDNEPHTVTATNGNFDSGNMNPGGTFTYTFRTPGSYIYTCTYHPWMRGYVTVLEAN